MSAALHESFSVATMDGDEIVYIARSTVSRVMSDDLHIGSRLPAYCTSIGRVLLAYMPAEQLEQYLARVVLIPHTTRTVSSVDKLRAALRNVRRHGYAMVDQEYEVGLRRLPCLLLAHGTRGGDGESERKRAAHVAVRDADALFAPSAQRGDGVGGVSGLEATTEILATPE